MPDRIYCTLGELIEEIGVNGFQNEAAAIRFLKSASDFIDRRLGLFIPLTAAKTFDGNGCVDLLLPEPLLAVTALTDNGDTIASTEYQLYPLNRHWQNGPYTRVGIDPDATTISTWTRERGTVSITGRWGKYEELVSTGQTVQNTTEITASGTSLLVGNGAKISPGMALLIESEQVLVEATGAATDSTANTAEAVDTSEIEFGVNTGTLVNIGEIIKIDFEQMRVVDIRTNTLLVTRGWNGTTKATHTNATDVYVYRTFTVKRGINGTTAATHANGTAISRYVVPPEIRYLITETAVMRMEKSKTKYAGRQGNPDLGETFYYGDFPDKLFKECQKMFRVNLL